MFGVKSALERLIITNPKYAIKEIEELIAFNKSRLDKGKKYE